ncbi:Alkaline phosphatase synthesis transcriptional regulatory protein PhoP [Ruegeria denitrificans]|uniref:Alkaline phosphatase synthesis transcriptional regulatory protein PhoP n=1 Tax=Ruegeria denitrificans TaxID=1715692 RepID=A0A0P1IEX6_9RHOB|nr:response regulator transcription factor [Ruegeria denitrificans]CUK09144.1 Alkaline phosphatase synthesis transcriptional regulatory protein PhoP [Ruegeria denitrificans]
MKILLVDDDPRLRDLVGLALERAGFQVITASDGQNAVTHAAREAPDMIVLDIGLPEMDGFEVCRRIRARSDVPILFLTARDDEIDRILGLEMGADDYVTKPFSPRELVARVRAILKRVAGPRPSQPLTHGQITLDPGAHICRLNGNAVSLTATEFTLLTTLIERPGQVHSRSQLIQSVWGALSQVSDRTLDSHLRNLRGKLTQAGCTDAIETVHGVGIRIQDTTA